MLAVSAGREGGLLSREDIFLFISSETEFPYIAQASPQFSVLLPQHPDCWDYSHAPPCLSSASVCHWLRGSVGSSDVCFFPFGAGDGLSKHSTSSLFLLFVFSFSSFCLAHLIRELILQTRLWPDVN